VVDVITEQAELDRQAMTGLSAYTEEDDNVLQLTRARLPWLLIGMTGGLVAANWQGFFGGDIGALPAISFFIPLMGGTGGNVGIQSSSIMVQSLASRTGLTVSTTQRLVKVLLVALLNGLVLSSLVLVFNLLFGTDLNLSVAVSTALVTVVLLASLMGTITPIILNRLG
jgi:magnesium transporter